MPLDQRGFEIPDETKPLDEVGQVLLRAADRIRERGWCRNALTNEKGFMCILGAICFGDTGRPNYPGNRSWDAMQRVTKVLMLHTHTEVVDWNNKIASTADDVIAVLEQAARKGA